MISPGDFLVDFTFTNYCKLVIFITVKAIVAHLVEAFLAPKPILVGLLV